MDEVFKALADPNRRRLLDALNDRDGQSLAELCADLPIARQSISKHLALLEVAGLVSTVREGRHKLHYVNAEPLTAIAGGWLNRYNRAATPALGDRVVDDAPEVTEFRYTTYIRTTPERLWQAVTNPAVAPDYLGHAIESAWLKGSSYVWIENGTRTEHPDQVILESDPYRRLGFTFRTLAADVSDLTEELLTAAAAEPCSRVHFDIEPLDDLVRLTLVHDDVSPGSVVLPLISHSWPIKLAHLKSRLEQDAPQPA
ncbi:ArsR family transcriptional regulator [Mycobacterium sp. 852013-50091_SCH5140682]|uniref:ArsR/SmtB family transcription factor n=1 Tax=Mycobacterium sp. 852013-50091_SCH5140682 TaxID=1834109 RepID=UPI0007E9841E|nr:metalloregulator ArsR/SmtB family transcription factor [Mycobacterium sp. 852013-50091_SCH5140682]OBC07038.1 ArsR family transcriptional regulator [Mycobacterium sp. 852013-50091_SCH5140682]